MGVPYKGLFTKKTWRPWQCLYINPVKGSHQFPLKTVPAVWLSPLIRVDMLKEPVKKIYQQKRNPKPPEGGFNHREKQTSLAGQTGHSLVRLRGRRSFSPKLMDLVVKRTLRG